MGFNEFGFEELERELEKIGSIDRYAPKILKEAAPALEKRLKQQVEKQANRGFATGSLKKSIKPTKPRKNEKGYYVAVTANGKDEKNVRNNEKLAYLEYGTSKQIAHPVISKATKNAEKECLEIMQRVFDEL